ncbi:ABC transporter substrate-binding protein [Mesorhizobium sp. ASY16-5R]|uniref:ABC transporter substrate-binding protein n=1 Tax=Mesorhizobium sp. ASY16-5R TaxID=3445772 RepID=UPI003FA0C71C
MRISTTRRGFIWGAASSALAAPFVSRKAFAQTSGEVIQCNFGGGVAEAFQKSYGDLFTATTGIPFKIVEVPSTETALISNASSQVYNSSFHSFSGAMNLYKKGITEPLAIADYPVLQDIPENLLPRIDDKHVAGMPINFVYYGIAYNTDLAEAEDFRSWQSLVDPKWKGQISVTRPVYASLYDVPWYSKMLTEDQSQLDAGIKQYKAVVDNALTAYTSMAQNQQLLERGDAVASAYYSDRIWDLKAKGGTKLDMTLPEEGALMIPYVFVIPKNAPHPEAARAFAAFAGSPEPQQRDLELQGNLPSNRNAAVDNELIKSRLGVTREEIIAKTFNPDWLKIQEQREALIKRLEAEISQP